MSDDQEIEIEIDEIDNNSLKNAILDQIEKKKIFLKAKIRFIIEIENGE